MSKDAATAVDDPAPTTDPASAAALGRHAARMRPLRIGYALTLTSLVVVIIMVVVVAYNRGEISHVTLKTVATGPRSLALQAPSQNLTKAWSSTDVTALGVPYRAGTVVTHDAHTVRGRDARTGKQTWSYTRADRQVCAALQNDGLTLAVYKLHRDCDEVTALDSVTGKRDWTRTLDKDRAVFDGPARFAVHGGTFLLVSATSIYALASGGLDYWTFHHVGCTINSVVLGDAGALISQTCAHESCGGAKFCGNGRQLLLRDAISGYDDNSKTNQNNPDKIIWNTFGSALVPALAGHQVAAYAPAGGTLELLNTKTGKLDAQIALSGGSATASASTATSDADLFWTGGRTYALPMDGTSFSWEADTVTVPTVTGSAAGAAPSLATSRLAVSTTAGIAQLDPSTGNPAQSFAVGAPAAGSLVYPLGTGFIVAGASTTVYQ